MRVRETSGLSAEVSRSCFDDRRMPSSKRRQQHDRAQFSSNDAWFQYFDYGNQYSDDKDYKNRARAVRISSRQRLC